MGYFKGIIFGVTLLNLIACDDANIVQVEEELSPQDLSIDSVVFEGGARGTLHQYLKVNMPLTIFQLLQMTFILIR